MKSVQTPQSNERIMTLDNRSQNSLSVALQSASVSNKDIKRI